MIADGRTDGEPPGKPIGFGCPECGGGMYEIRTGHAVHYLCHVGHSWSPQSFVAASDNGIEEALWTAVSAMQEKARMLASLAANAQRAGEQESSRAYQDQADRVLRDAELIRIRILEEGRKAGEQRPA